MAAKKAAKPKKRSERIGVRLRIEEGKGGGYNGVPFRWEDHIPMPPNEKKDQRIPNPLGDGP